MGHPRRVSNSARTRQQRVLQRKNQAPLQVMVFATMSAGKSTFVNSLVGSELLHCANEATTAVWASVASMRPGSVPSATCYGADRSVVAQSHSLSAQELKAWNADARVRHISVQAPFIGCHVDAGGLVLHDTPGPNNSQDGGHSQRAFEALRNTELDIVCYVLNAGQLGINDDQQLLAQLRKELEGKPGTELIFILNKVDLLDPERGESVADHLALAHSYLERNGFLRPCIVPTMSQSALLAKKHLHGAALTLKERSQLRRDIEAIAATAPRLPPTLGLAGSISRRCLDALARMKARSRLPQTLSSHPDELDAVMHLLAQSGIPTVEALFQRPNKS